jgi:hypothetical protein
MADYKFSASTQAIKPLRPGNTSISLGQDNTQTSSQSQKSMIPHDLLGWSIVNTLFFNIFLGIVAIVFSVLTRRHVNKNKLAEAYQSSQFAFKVNLVATTLGSIFWIIAIIVGSIILTFLTSLSFLKE